MRIALIWVALILVAVIPFWGAAQSPLLAWRDPIYIAASFAGIAALICLLAQPLLVRGRLPGIAPVRQRRWHRRVGMGLGLCVLAHILGLWITSPPDVIDVLLFRSPTPFSVWGALAMWAVLLMLGMVALRRHLRIRMQSWRRVHLGLALVLVATTVAHILPIDGTMTQWSKIMLSALAGLAAASVVFRG